MSPPEHNYVLHDLNRRRDILQINHGMFFTCYTGHDIEKQQDIGQGNWSHDWDMNQIQVITNRKNRLRLVTQREDHGKKVTRMRQN